MSPGPSLQIPDPVGVIGKSGRQTCPLGIKGHRMDLRVVRGQDHAKVSGEAFVDPDFVRGIIRAHCQETPILRKDIRLESRVRMANGELPIE